MKTFRKSSHPNRQKLPSSTTSHSLGAPTQRKLESWPTFLPPVVWVCLHSFSRCCLPKMPSSTKIPRKFELIAVQGHPRSSILVPSKAHMRVSNFLLVTSSNFGPMHRFWDTASQRLRLLAENSVFFLPFCQSAPPLSMFPLEFRGEVNHEETRIVGLLYVVKVA